MLIFKEKFPTSVKDFLIMKMVNREIGVNDRILREKVYEA